MLVSVKKLPKSEVEIEGELEADLFEAYFTKALKKIGENLKIDGFRKGKIPESVLISKVGDMRVLEEMAELAISEYYPKILSGEIQSEKIDPVRGREGSQRASTSNGIDAIGRPEIFITKLARKNPLGFKIKTAVLPAVKLPDYKSIAKKIIAEIAEEVPTLNEVGTPTENVGGKTRLKIIEKIIAESEIEVPEILVEIELDKILYRMESDITAMGLKFEDYLKHLNKTVVDLRKEFRTDADKKARLGLILNEIAKVEKIVVDPEQVSKEIAQILEHYKDADPKRAQMHAENVLTNEKIFQFLEGQ